ncbi:MAG: DUF61 family protein [Sulfolobales archaeon]|nr:DUF61 family protein [Sulfolobales archaeon]MCX8185642.1 DUF61 family protein [Sulfolobales archaeon]MDW7969585.1 DUF61 family protein [Sulfolobales archaeon]
MSLNFNFDDYLEKYLTYELRIVNRYLPMKRKKLRELLIEEHPHVVCSDGSIHMFRKDELNTLLKYVSDEELNNLALPIILELRVDMDVTTALVREKYAVSVISKILGIERTNNELYLYPPHLSELRRKVGTLIQYFISTSEIRG